MRLFLFFISAIAILAIFFFGTMYVIDYRDMSARDLVRAEHAKSLKTALERYRAAHGKYPAPFTNNYIMDLKTALVDGGFLAAIPTDPFWIGSQNNQYTYVSADGIKYGLWFHLELSSGKIPAGGGCLTGVGTVGTGWWGQPPDCPF